MINIQVKKLSKSFSNKLIIDDLSLDLNSRDRLLVTGANAVGKTTLLKILSGHLFPDSGDLNLEGRAFSSYSFVDLKNKVSYVSSNESHLYPRLTGRENIYHFSKVISINSELLEHRITKWCSLSLFEESLKTSYHLCSQGMKKVLEIFVLTLSNPSILIMDECFKSFDPVNRKDVLELIDTEFKESIIILSSHHKEEISEILKVEHFHLEGPSNAN